MDQGELKCGLGPQESEGAHQGPSLRLPCVAPEEEEVACLPSFVSPMHCLPTLPWKPLGLDSSLWPDSSKPCCPLIGSQVVYAKPQYAVCYLLDSPPSALLFILQSTMICMVFLVGVGG